MTKMPIINLLSSDYSHVDLLQNIFINEKNNIGTTTKSSSLH